MDKKELAFMRSRFREFFQKHREFRAFRDHLKKNCIDLTGGVILDVGCGSGYSCELILEEFQPVELFAFDVMPEQVQLARQRGLAANIFLGDITNIDLPSRKFDAVFVFGILHHVPEWRGALEELNRVLKPGGVLLVEEPDRQALDDGERYLRLYHPKESRFEWPEFVKGLEEAGFSVVESRKIYLGHLMSFMCIKSRGKE